MNVVKIPMSDIEQWEGNPKIHTKEQIQNIKNSIMRFSMCDPIGVWGEENIIVEGHGRYQALKELGYNEIPCIRLDHLTDKERKAYALAHNQITLETTWDFELLEQELNGILDIDMSEFGFDMELYDESTEPHEDGFNVDAAIPDKPVTKRGNIWVLRNHRLMCGDSTSGDDVERLMGGVKADMVFTDPPYNVSYESVDGSRKGQIQNDSFTTDEECAEKLWRPAFQNMRDYAMPHCSFYMTMPQGGTHMMMMMMSACWQVKHELIWLKQSIVLNRADYNYRHEPILFGWAEKHIFYGKGKFKNTSVWEIDRPTKSKEHPTMKPIELISETLLNSSKESDVVLDLFGGSGSTLIACEQLGRRCYMMEIDEKYCDVIIDRWEQFTGQKAELIST